MVNSNWTTLGPRLDHVWTTLFHLETLLNQHFPTVTTWTTYKTNKFKTAQ
nr:MAG TPA: hypothetical protein [Caudoviricetes sp.]